MNINLDACPFCGGEAVLNAYSDSEGKLNAYVVCRSCGAQVAFFDEIDAAVNAWNSRVFSRKDIETIQNAYSTEAPNG